MTLQSVGLPSKNRKCASERERSRFLHQEPLSSSQRAREHIVRSDLSFCSSCSWQLQKNVSQSEAVVTGPIKCIDQPCFLFKPGDMRQNGRRLATLFSSKPVTFPSFSGSSKRARNSNGKEERSDAFKFHGDILVVPQCASDCRKTRNSLSARRHRLLRTLFSTLSVMALEWSA